MAVALLGATTAPGARAETAPSEAPFEDQLKAQALRAERLDALIAQQAREIEELKRSLAALRDELARQRSGTARPSAPVAEAAHPATGPAPPSEVGQDQGKDVQSANAAVAPILERASVLTPDGHWSLEPSLQYAYSSKNQVSILGVSILPAITVGLIDIERVSQTTDLAALTARYGIAPRSEIELRLPYVYGDQDTVGRPFGAASSSEISTGAHGSGIGDVELATRHQFTDPRGSLPYLIGEARVRAPSGTGPFSVPVDATTGLPKTLPTGTGFWGAFASATAIYPSDPAAFFGSANYLWNFGRSVSGGLGYVKPGNSVGLNFGMGLSLNEAASISIGYEHDWLSKTTEAGVTLPSTNGLQVGRLLVGYSLRLSSRSTLNASVAIGATDAAPNTQLTVRVPYTL